MPYDLGKCMYIHRFMLMNKRYYLLADLIKAMKKHRQHNLYWLIDRLNVSSMFVKLYAGHRPVRV